MFHRRRHRRFRVFGWPEIGLVCTAALVLAPAVLWMRFEGRQQWRQTTGFARSARIESTHYNAVEYATKVTLEFEYAVNGMAYRDTWVGFWPSAGGPNAMDPAELEKLTRDGFPLAVFYDPASPTRNYLHPDADLVRGVYAVWIAAAVALFLLYGIRAYPRLRA